MFPPRSVLRSGEQKSSNCVPDRVLHWTSAPPVTAKRFSPSARLCRMRHSRHTYATRHLQDGIDIRTLQQWMGHRDIASTMVYLKGVRNSDIQVRLNRGSLAAFA